jgi:TRAP-type C4-dicarboxylate transport system permease small subunit
VSAGRSSGLDRLCEAVATGLRWSLVAAALVMLVSIFVQVVMRYVFSRAPAWSEELAVLMFSWATMGGLALGIREGFHVALTLVLDPLPPRVRSAWLRAIALLTAALGAFLVWAGWRFLDITSGSTSAAMEYPIELLNVMAPISGALIFLFALGHAVAPTLAPKLEDAAQ